jgi:hypothetical protein
MIYIGLQLNGPELGKAPIDRLLTLAAKAAAEARGGFTVGLRPAMNVVFYVPGSLGDFPNITKVAAGRFSRKQKLLLVEVPVPRDVAEAGGPVEFVIGALRRAIAIAADVFARKGPEPFEVAKAEAIVERVKEALAAQPR